MGRGQFYRVSVNRLQHPGDGESDGRRFRGLQRPIRPWRTAGRHILVCPNSAAHFALFRLDADAWVAEVTQRLQAMTDRPIVVRWKRDSGRRPLWADLVDAWAVVAWSSVAALDALIAGVPVFVLAPHAAAYRMGLSDLSRIESPRYPEDRQRFCGVLADHQWLLSELRSGQAWRMLQAGQETHAAA